jgi:hypothetical protein
VDDGLDLALGAIAIAKPVFRALGKIPKCADGVRRCIRIVDRLLFWDKQA